MNRRAAPTILLLAAALLAGGCSADDYVAPPPPQQGSEVAPAAAGDTIQALQKAIQTDDATAAGELGADVEATERLAAIAKNATALGLTDITFRYVAETGSTSDDGVWDGMVAVTWRHEGFDEASARVEIPFSFAEAGDRIAGVGGQRHRLPVWLSGAVSVRRTAGTVVFGPVPATELARYARWARVAATDVRGILRRRARLVVEVPPDAAALHHALDAARGEYDAIAAVTAPVDGSSAPGSPVHVFLNPTVFGDLEPVAAQVVMTHETVHAVTGAALARRGPLWLVEGFADYIALRDVDLPLSRTAGQIIAQIRRDGLPGALPSATDFDTGSSHLGAAYEAAWLVCVTLAERSGGAALVGLYDAVLGGASLDAELRTRFGWSEADLTAAWRARLAVAAGVSE
ncbi:MULTISPECIES: hypothetical protein [Nocardioides]|uniref:Peptidase MA-like domain-containing protein n=1 Tax=Nocardioides vastitatis TaxID=2568655 RepID=A0ABW0ZEH5_9ACTN|nr:hypothetical protein [Nocardioides sp.]THJ12593.1 hypothetical protein E7Z54_02050 [Nocardioides sp.]